MSRALAVLVGLALVVLGAITAFPERFNALVPHDALAYVGVVAAGLAVVQGLLPAIHGRLGATPFTLLVAVGCTVLSGFLTPLLALGPVLPFPPETRQLLTLVAIALGYGNSILPAVYVRPVDDPPIDAPLLHQRYPGYLE